MGDHPSTMAAAVASAAFLSRKLRPLATRASFVEDPYFWGYLRATSRDDERGSVKSSDGELCDEVAGRPAADAKSFHPSDSETTCEEPGENLFLNPLEYGARVKALFSSADPREGILIY